MLSMEMLFFHANYTFVDNYNILCLKNMVVISLILEYEAAPVIAKYSPGQAKSVRRGARHVLHHLVLHLLQDQVQGLSWIQPCLLISNLKTDLVSDRHEVCCT